MDLVKKDDIFSTAFSEIENAKKMCDILMKTPHYAKMGPEGIYAIIAKARSLEIDPIDALNGALYYVGGRVGMSTEAMAARMRAAGHSIQKDIKKCTSTCCVLIGRRADNGDVWETSFSVDDAKRAGIYNERGPWGKYPSVMCYNRAMSMLFRQLTPDLSKGVGYTLDELKEIACIETTPTPQVLTQMQTEPEIISKDQAEDLWSIFLECDPEYYAKVLETLKRPPIAIDDLKKLPLHLFERLKTAAIKNRDEYREYRKEADQEMHEDDAEV